MDNKKKQDDYLKKSEYEGHPKSEKHSDFSIFESKGEHYFAMLDKNGNVALRSEGYASDKGRDNGIESVIKNRDNEDRWSIAEAFNHFFISLKAGNHQEIGKTGSYKSKAEAEAYLAFLLGKGAAPAVAKEKSSKGGGAKAAGAGAAIAGGAVSGRVISVKRNFVKENRRVLKETRKDPKEVSRKQVGENRKQIGESRNLINTSQKVTKYAAIAGAASLGAMSFMEMEEVKSGGPAPIKEVVAGKAGGWWPLLLFLLPLIFLFLPAAAPIAPIAFATIPIPVAAKTCDCGSLTNKVFNIPDGEPPKTTTRLGLDPEYGDSHGLTGTQFYQKLKGHYDNNTNGKERNFLDGLFKQMGYENGFADASGSLFTEVTIPQGINANLGGNMKHKTYYRKMMTKGKDREAFRIKAANYCDMYFMKTCGNHMYYDENCGTES